MRMERRHSLQDKLNLPAITEACLLKSGPEPGVEAVAGLPVLVLGLFLGLWIPAVAASALFTVVLMLKRRSITAVVTDKNLVVFENSRFDGRTPLPERSSAPIPLEHVSIRILKESGGSIRLLMNGNKFWANLRDADDARKLVELIGKAQR